MRRHRPSPLVALLLLLALVGSTASGTIPANRRWYGGSAPSVIVEKATSSPIVDARDNRRLLTGQTTNGDDTPGGPSWVRLADGVHVVQNDFKITSVDTGADTITVESGHGLANDDRVQFLTKYRPGDDTGPDYIVGGFALDTFYYVKNLSTNTFQLAASAGGSAIDVTGSSYGWNRIQAQRAVLDERDGSATAANRVKWVAAPKTSPRILAGQAVTDGDWKQVVNDTPAGNQVNDSWAWARIPAGAKTGDDSAVYRLDVAGLGYDTGDMDGYNRDFAGIIRLIVGTEMKWMSRYPDWPDDDEANWKLVNTGDITGGTGVAGDTVTYTITDTTPGGWDEASQDIYAQGCFDWPYHVHWQPVSALATESGTKTRITATKIAESDFPETGTVPFICLRNAMEALTSDSYVWNKTQGYLYYWCPSGAPTGAYLTTPQTGLQLGESGGTASDAPDYVTFRRIAFEGSRRSALQCYDTTNVAFEYCTFRNWGDWAIDARQNTNWSFSNGTFSNGANASMLWITGGTIDSRTESGNSLTDSTITELGRDVNADITSAIKTLAELVTDDGTTDWDAALFGFTFARNQVSWLRHALLHGGVNVTIEDSIFDRVMIVYGDTGAIGGYGRIGVNNTVRGCTFTNMERVRHGSSYGAKPVIYLDMDGGWTIEDNSFTDLDVAVFMTTAKDVIVRRNKFDNANQSNFQAPITIGARHGHADPGDLGYASINNWLTDVDVSGGAWTTFDSRIQNYRTGGSLDADLWDDIEGEGVYMPVIVDNAAVNGSFLIYRVSGDNGPVAVNGVNTGLWDAGPLAQLNYPIEALAGMPVEGGGDTALSALDKLD